MKNLGLAYKFMIPLLLIMVTAQAIGTLVIYGRSSAKLQEQQVDTMQRLQAEQVVAQNERMNSLQARADLIGGFLSKSAVGPILFDDQEALGNQQQNAKSNGIAYVLFLGPDSTPLVKSDRQPDRSAAIEKTYDVVSKDKIIGQVAVGISKQDYEAFERSNQTEIDKLAGEIEHKRQEVASDLLYVNLSAAAIMLVLVSAVLMLLFRKLVLKPLRDGSTLMRELASGEGDLTVQLPVPNRDEISALLSGINQFTGKLRTMVQDMVESSQTLSSSAGELTVMMQESESRIEHQQQETSAVAAAITQMASTVHEVARNTANAAEAAQKANESAHTGHATTERAVKDINMLVTRIEQTAAVINRLNEDAAQVGSVLEVIRGIAEQTNLLALNAAIEAARAGEQGRGFAVVADEVRTLAGRTQQSTEEIRDIIEKLQSGSVSAVEAMNTAQESGQQGAQQVHSVAVALNEIRNLVQQINDMNTQIASATEEQSAVAEEISNNIARLNQIGQESAASSAESAQSSVNLAGVAQHLHQVAGMFRV